MTCTLNSDTRVVETLGGGVGNPETFSNGGEAGVIEPCLLEDVLQNYDKYLRSTICHTADLGLGYRS
jgi:hypothetical protein